MTMSMVPEAEDSLVVAAWNACLYELEQMTSSTADSLPVEARAERIQKHLDKGNKNEYVSLWAFQQLVYVHLVPEELCTAVVKASKTHLSAADKAHAVRAAANAMLQFLRSFTNAGTAVQGRCMREEVMNAIVKKIKGAEAKHAFAILGQTLRSQIEESGVLQHLPTIMVDTTTALLQHTALPEAQPPPPPAAAMAAAAAAARGKQRKAPGLIAFVDILKQAHVVLELSKALSEQSFLFTASQRDIQCLKRGAHCTPKAMELVMACYISASNMVHWGGQLKESASHAMFEVLQKANHFVVQLAGSLYQVKPGLAGDPTRNPELYKIAACPHYERCLLLCMGFTAYGVLGMQEEGKLDSSSSNSSGAAAGGSSRKAHQQQRGQSRIQKAWQVGQQIQQFITPAQQKLLSSLGVGRTLFAWAAAMQKIFVLDVLHVLAAAYVDTHRVDKGLVSATDSSLTTTTTTSNSTSTTTTSTGSSSSSSSTSLIGRLQEAQLHLLLPSVLLNTAAAIKPDSERYLEGCMLAADTSLVAVQRWQQLTRGDTDALITAVPSAAVQQAVQMTKGALLDVLPAVLSLLGSMLQCIHDGTIDIGSSSCSNSTWLTMKHERQGPTPAGTVVAERNHRTAVSDLVAVLCSLLQDCLPPLATSQAPPAAAAAAAGSGLRLSDLQPGQLTSILKQLQGFVRITAAAPGWLRLSEQGLQRRYAVSPVSSTAWDALHQLLSSRTCDFVYLVCSSGPDSTEVKELYGLLISLIKAGVACQGVAPALAAALPSSTAAAAAADMLTYSMHGNVGTVLPAAAEGAACSAEAGGATSAATEGAAAEGNAAGLLPSLVIIGRWCLQTAREGMQTQPPGSVATAIREKARDTVSSRLRQLLFYNDDSLQGPFQTCHKTCLDWLQQGAVSAQLSAAGYNPGRMQQRAEEMVQAHAAVEKESVNGAVAVTAMIGRLQALGQALTAVAIRHACNNAQCGNVGGLSERGLLSRRTTCGNCRVAQYCSSECQAQHWKPEHMPVCNAVKRAARQQRAAHAAGSTAGNS